MAQVPSKLQGCEICTTMGPRPIVDHFIVGGVFRRKSSAAIEGASKSTAHRILSNSSFIGFASLKAR